MRNASNDFRQEIDNDNRNYFCQAIITLTNGEILEVDNTDIWFGGVSVDDNVSDSSSFTSLGSVIINSASLIINNINDDYSSYDFKGAIISIKIGLNINEEVEYIPMFSGIINNATYSGSLITLDCLDNMTKFDKPYINTQLEYPATLGNIIYNACTECGVPLAPSMESTFPNHDLEVSLTIDSSTTYREVISKVAELAGCFARCNSSGELELKWFNSVDINIDEESSLDGGIFDSGSPYSSGDTADGGSFNPWNNDSTFDGGTLADKSKIHIIDSLSSQDIGTDDITITGIRITFINTTKQSKNEDTVLTYDYGTDDYIIKIENNPFITKENVDFIGKFLWSRFAGLTFRKASISHLSNPIIEAGDVAVVIDRKQNRYPILITNTIFKTGSYQQTTCAAETQVRNNATQYTQEEKNYETLTEAINAKAGLYETHQAEPGGGYKYYLHDNPKLEESTVMIEVTVEGIRVSPDAGETWYGLTVDGNFIGNIMNTIGINFNWGVGGILTIKNGNITTFYANADTGEVNIIANSFSLSNGDTIESIAENAVDSQTQLDIFNKLTNNGQTQGIYLSDGKLYLNADYIRSGHFSANYIQGGTLTLGGQNNVNGTLNILDASNNVIGQWTNAGITLNKGVLQSSDYSHTSGTYSTAGMCIDLVNKFIRSTKFALLNNGELSASDAHLEGSLVTRNTENTRAVTVNSGNISFYKTESGQDLALSQIATSNWSGIYQGEGNKGVVFSVRSDADYIALGYQPIDSGSSVDSYVGIVINRTLNPGTIGYTEKVLVMDTFRATSGIVTNTNLYVGDHLYISNSTISSTQRTDYIKTGLDLWTADNGSYSFINAHYVVTGDTNFTNKTIIQANLTDGSITYSGGKFNDAIELRGGSTITDNTYSNTGMVRIYLNVANGAVAKNAIGAGKDGDGSALNNAIWLYYNSESDVVALNRSYNGVIRTILECDSSGNIEYASGKFKGNIKPRVDYQSGGTIITCGDSSFRWYQVWSTSFNFQTGVYINYNSTNDYIYTSKTIHQASDENLKNISKYDTKYDELLDKLEPIVYTWKDSNSNKQHVGLGARKTKKLLDDLKLTDSGFVGIDLDENGNERYSVDYSELSAMLLHTVQVLKKKVEELERRL